MGEEFLQQFGLRLARLLNPGLPLPTVQAAILQVIAEAKAAGSLPQNHVRQPTTASGASFAGRKLELVFAHDCRNHGCNVPHCVLCKHNPNKRCSGNFAQKYWVGDRLLAKCDGEIQVELIDTDTHQRVMDDLSFYTVEACVLEGHKYNTKCREAGEQRLEILDECEVLLNQKNEPLLVSASANNTAKDPRVVLKFPPGGSSVPLRELKVTESSESVLAGTKRPPFRLVVRLIAEDGTRLPVRPAVSEEFVVVTKRTKNLKKQEIPSLDDPIAKLNHVGKETVKKLNELKASADEMMIDLGLPRDLDRITKVKDFLKLARLSEADGHLQQKLKQLLKLSKEKWDAACEHAKTAVQVDNRMRAWYEQNMSVGLLYPCTLGDVRPDCPVALIQNRRHEGVEFMEVIPMEHQLPSQREQVQDTCEQAIQCWWRDSHPGWMIFTLGNKHFETLDQIIQFSRSERQAEEVAEPDEDSDLRDRRVHSFAEPPGQLDVARPSDGQNSNGDHLTPSTNHVAPEHAPPAPPSRMGAGEFPTDTDQAGHENGGQALDGQQQEGGLLTSDGSGSYNPFEILTSLPFSGFGNQLPASAASSEDVKLGRSPQEMVMTTAAAALAAGNLPSMLPQLFSLGTLAKLGSVPSLGLLNDLGLLSVPPDADSNGQLPPASGTLQKVLGLEAQLKEAEASEGGKGKRRLEVDTSQQQKGLNGGEPEPKHAAVEGQDGKPSSTPA